MTAASTALSLARAATSRFDRITLLILAAVLERMERPAWVVAREAPVERAN